MELASWAYKEVYRFEHQNLETDLLLRCACPSYVSSKQQSHLAVRSYFAELEILNITAMKAVSTHEGCQMELAPVKIKLTII